MAQREQLAKLKEEVEQCHRCALRQQCIQTVFGEGAAGKGLMVIGEGPGQDEDLQGRPFVGRAGRLLDRILESAGFSRKANTYIANIVKCRPPGNRDPLPEEREACLPYLMEQIQIIAPKIILLLGATAIQGLIDPKAKIGSSRGKWMDWQGIQVIATYHPAALLRNPGFKAVVWEDIQMVIDKYRELVDPDHFSEYH
ncbi:MAG: uracil-DNA glycosylase [Clostridiales bacterium]|nr:uracil-DNA glycosylase [Clostridiales bacterium]